MKETVGGILMLAGMVLGGAAMHNGFEGVREALCITLGVGVLVALVALDQPRRAAP